MACVARHCYPPFLKLVFWTHHSLKTFLTDVLHIALMAQMDCEIAFDIQLELFDVLLRPLPVEILMAPGLNFSNAET